MNILIIDESEPFESVSFGFLNKVEFSIIERVHIKNLSVSKLDLKPDIVVINLADVRDNSGHFIRKIKTTLNTPILGVLHVASDVQLAVALALGVDDCVFHPFTAFEFTARLKALTRSHVQPQQYLGKLRKFGPLEVNMDKYEVKRGDQVIQLTRTEFMILSILASNTDKVFLKEEMYQLLWNDKYYDNGNALNVHIRRLRKKIELNPEKPDHIVTKWGIGYKFEY